MTFPAGRLTTAALATLAVATAALLCCSPALAAGSPSYLFSIPTASGSLTGHTDRHLKLRLTGTRKYLTRFTDRPLRQASVVANVDFARRFKTYFSGDAPNAVLTYVRPGAKIPVSIVLTIRHPRWSARHHTWTFSATRIRKQRDNLPGTARRIKPPTIPNPRRFTRATLLIDDASPTAACSQGPNHAGENCSSANFAGADLSGADFSGTNLTSANLARANLSGAYLADANLYGASLRGANLSGARLDSASLSHADLAGATLTGGIVGIETDFSYANLTGVDLTGAQLLYAGFRMANLTGANLTGASATNASFSNANLTNANLTNTDLTSTDLSVADLTGANLTNTLLADVELCYTTLPSGQKLDCPRG